MPLNYLAIFTCAVASMIVGGLWYGPIFGKLFIRTQGGNKDTKGMPMTYVGQFILSLITFATLNLFINAMGMAGFTALEASLIAWFGFLITFKLGDSLWTGKMTLFWLSAGCSLITFLVAGAILGAWRY